MTMDEILIPDTKRIGDAHELPQQPVATPHWSGLGFAVRRNGQPTDCPAQLYLKQSHKIVLNSPKDYRTSLLQLISSHLKCHTRKPGASQGLYLDGESETDVGAVMAF